MTSALFESFYITVWRLLLCLFLDALSDERSGLSIVSQSLDFKSSVGTYLYKYLHFRHINLCTYTISKASVSALTAVAVNLRPTVSRPVCPGVRSPSGTCDQFFFLLEISFTQLRVRNFIAPSLTRGRVCKLLYSCFWTLPEQSLLGRSPAELTAIFYCLIWDPTNLEGQDPLFGSHVSAVRNFQCYYWEGCMGSMQCNVEFGYQLSRTFRMQPTSSQQSGIKSANPNISPYSLLLYYSFLFLFFSFFFSQQVI
jgi:hypothetical protein